MMTWIRFSAVAMRSIRLLSLSKPVLSSHRSQATNTTALLSFPDVSAHAQWNQPSAPAVPQLTSPASPSIPQLSLPQLTLPAVPDPLDAFLSLQDGHTSGDSVVSTQHSTCSAASPSGSATRSPEEVLDDAAREAELTGLWKAATIDEPPVNAQAENRNSHAIQDEIEISPTDMPGFRYAKSQTNSFVRLPRRIDHDLKLAQELGYYITLNRKTKVETLYGHLELSLDEGKRLSRDIKEVLKESKLIQLISKPTGTATATKKVLIRIALYLLISKDWGRIWFGENHKNAATRKYLWPRDSSILLSGFVMVLYRIYTNTKQQFLAMLRTQATMKNANSDGAASSSSSPVPSAQPATPTLIHLEGPTADGQSFFAALVNNAVAGKKRKRDEAVLGLDEGDSTYPVEVPPNARLKYHVYVKDKTDGADIMPPTTYRHTDYLIARGAFSSLKAAFEAASQNPVYEIQTPSGRRKVTTEAEWDAAVLTIYNARRVGGVVEVDIFV
ncbi:hypothetical protein P885DRAFT_26730 [Corynascus similis CBS 632.67]